MGGISVLMMMGIFSGFVILFFIFVAVIVIYSLVNYIFESLFLYGTCKKLGIPKKGLSWIPFYNKVILGKVANKEVMGKVLFGLEILSYAVYVLGGITEKIVPWLSTILLVLWIVIIVSIFVLNLLLSYKLMSRVTYKFAPLLLVINVLTLNFSKSIILFSMKNSEKILKD